jgi:hypothetical protein
VGIGKYSLLSKAYWIKITEFYFGLHVICCPSTENSIPSLARVWWKAEDCSVNLAFELPNHSSVNL